MHLTELRARRESAATWAAFARTTAPLAWTTAAFAWAATTLTRSASTLAATSATFTTAAAFAASAAFAAPASLAAAPVAGRARIRLASPAFAFLSRQARRQETHTTDCQNPRQETATIHNASVLRDMAGMYPKSTGAHVTFERPERLERLERSERSERLSVPEMPSSGEHHRQPVFVGGGNHFLVAY